MIDTKQLSNPKSIAKINIERLFNKYSYDIPREGSANADLSRLLILYGLNGSGKTTILNLIYHMLSSERLKGHRTYLARQPFKKFSIEFMDGTRVTAEKLGDMLIGSFDWSISKGKKTIAEVRLETDEEQSIPGISNPKLESKYEAASHAIDNLNIQLYYLSDDRKSIGEVDEYVDFVPDREDVSQVSIRRIRRTVKSEVSPLDRAISNLVNWARGQVLKASNIGETNVSSLYNEVMERILKNPLVEQVSTEQTQELVQTINILAEKNREFVALGFLPSLNLESVANMVKGAEETKRSILHSIVKPYIDSINARFKALDGIKNVINTFIRNINQFYVDKQIQYDLGHGLKVVSNGDQELSPRMLSSGEKQLLLLLCYIIVAREKPSIVLIDEPELSLNVTWQRNLVRTLLECVEANNLQLLLATHSIELLTQYNRNVVELESISKPQ
jgi:energy-coupling factor transporter ATP-binding protein EcfA2